MSVRLEFFFLFNCGSAAVEHRGLKTVANKIRLAVKAPSETSGVYISTGHISLLLAALPCTLAYGRFGPFV